MGNTNNKPSTAFTTARTIEIFLVVIVAVALLFKFMFWPGGNEILMLGFFSLMVLYTIGWQIALGSRKGFINNVFPRLVSFVMVFGLMGIIFRLMTWVGGVLVAIPALVICASFLVLGIVLAIAAKDKFEPAMRRWTLVRLVAVVLPLVYFFFVNQVDFYRMTGLLADDPVFMQLLEDCLQNGKNCEEYTMYRVEGERNYGKPKETEPSFLEQLEDE